MSVADKATGLLRRWLGSDNDHEAEACRKKLVDVLKANPELSFHAPEPRSAEIEARFRLYEERFGQVRTEHLRLVFEAQASILVVVGQLFGISVTADELRRFVLEMRETVARLARQAAESAGTTRRSLDEAPCKHLMAVCAANYVLESEGRDGEVHWCPDCGGVCFRHVKSSSDSSVVMGEWKIPRRRAKAAPAVEKAPARKPGWVEPMARGVAQGVGDVLLENVVYGRKKRGRKKR